MSIRISGQVIASAGSLTAHNEDPNAHADIRELISQGGGSSEAKWGAITGDINAQTDLTAAIAEKQDKLTAGEGITIEGNVISATGGGGGGGSVVIETEITEDSTDATVPSSKAVWDKVNVLEDRFVEGNPDYVVEGTGNLATIGGRAFTKKNEGLAYGMVCQINKHNGCILVSEIPEAVIINPPSYAAEGSFEYSGRTWYYSPDEHFMPINNEITLGLLKVIKTDTPFSTPLEAARYVIENGLNYKVNGLVTDVTNVKEDVSKLANAYTSSNLKAGTNIALTKTGYHKILSNFSSSKYVKFLKTFNPTSTYKMIVGLTTGSDVKTTQSILSVQGVDRNFYLKGSGSVFSYYPGSSVSGKTVAAAKTDYWLVFDYDGTTCKLYSAKDDGTYVNPKDLPALTDSFWTEELSYTTEIFKGKNLQLGKNGSTTAYWFGSINLGKVLITADGEDWFNGLTAQEGVDFTNTGCTVTSERVEGLDVSTSVDCTIEKLSQLEDDLGVYTKTNLIGGNGITIEEQAAQGGIDEKTLACWHFDRSLADEVSGLTFNGGYTSRPAYGDTKFGSGCWFGKGSSNYIPTTDAFQFNFDSEDYTIDFWINAKHNTNSHLLLNGIYLVYGYAGTVQLGNQTFEYDETTQPEWSHVAYTYHYSDRTYDLFLNGEPVQTGVSVNFGGDGVSITTLRINAYYASSIESSAHFLLDELRISKGIRYTKSFTPPKEAYSKAEPTGKYQINFTGEAVGASKNIGEVYYSQSSLATDNAGALPLFTGETIASANTIYPDFYKWVSERPELQIASDKYEEALATYGECPKYVLDIASTEETNSYKYTFPTTVPDTWVFAYLDNGEYVEFEDNGVYYSPVKIDHEYTLSSDELYYDEGLTKRIFVRMLYQSEPYQWFPVVFQTAADGSDTNGWILVLGRADAGFSPFYEDGAETTTISSTAALAPVESVVTRTTYTRDGSLRLPKLANYIKMANTTDGITQGEAGLPNITADFRLNKQDLRSANGALSLTGPGINTKYSADGASSSGNYGEATFSASNSSEVYGKSDTVTPAHTTLFPWVVAYTSSISASVAQAAEFQQGLSGKADADLGNIPTNIDYVVERYDDEQGNWYEVWKSGRLRQGGKLNSSSSGNLSFVFLKPFADNTYTIVTGVASGDNYVKSVQLNALTETGFNYKIATDGGGLTSQPCYYIAEGKGA